MFFFSRGKEEEEVEVLRETGGRNNELFSQNSLWLVVRRTMRGGGSEKERQKEGH